MKRILIVVLLLISLSCVCASGVMEQLALCKLGELSSQPIQKGVRTVLNSLFPQSRQEVSFCFPSASRTFTPVATPGEPVDNTPSISVLPDEPVEAQPQPVVEAEIPDLPDETEAQTPVPVALEIIFEEPTTESEHPVFNTLETIGKIEEAGKAEAGETEVAGSPTEETAGPEHGEADETVMEEPEADETSMEEPTFICEEAVSEEPDFIFEEKQSDAETVDEVNIELKIREFETSKTEGIGIYPEETTVQPEISVQAAKTEEPVAATQETAQVVYNFYGPVYVFNGASGLQTLPVQTFPTAGQAQQTSVSDSTTQYPVFAFEAQGAINTPANTANTVQTKTPKVESRFDLTINGGYGSMYVTADGVTRVPSDKGFNVGVKGLYRISNIFAAGIGVNFGQYHYDSKGYPGPYTVIDPCLVGEARLPLGDRFKLTLCLNAGYDIRMYEEQKGAYPTVFLSLEATYRLNEYLDIGIGGSGGFTFQNYEGDAKITAGAILRVNL